MAAVTAYASIAVLLLALTLAGFDSLSLLIPMLFASFAFLGLVIPSTMVLSLEHHGAIAGLAAAQHGVVARRQRARVDARQRGLARRHGRRGDRVHEGDGGHRHHPRTGG